MPNHVTNVVYTNSEIIEQISRTDERGCAYFDFNAFVPTPDFVYQGNLGREEEEKYGQNTWYAWNTKNWGTKWNSYDNDFSDDYVSFQTAWSHPAPVITEMSKKFPEEIFTIAYADEDFGFNCGLYRIKNGDIIERSNIEEGTPEATLLAGFIMYGSPKHPYIDDEIKSNEDYIERYKDTEDILPVLEELQDNLQIKEDNDNLIKDAIEKGNDITSIEGYFNL